MDEERLGERHGEWMMMMSEEVITYSGASQEEKNGMGMRERMAMVPTMTPRSRAHFYLFKKLLKGVVDRKEGICGTAMPMHWEHHSVVINGM